MPMDARDKEEAFAKCGQVSISFARLDSACDHRFEQSTSQLGKTINSTSHEIIPRTAHAPFATSSHIFQVGLDAMNKLETWLKDWHATEMPLLSAHRVTPIAEADRGDLLAARNVWEDAGAPTEGGLMERALLEQLNVSRLRDAIDDQDLEAVQAWEWRVDKAFFSQEQIAETWKVMSDGLQISRGVDGGGGSKAQPGGEERQKE